MRYTIYLQFNGNAKDAFDFYKKAFNDQSASYMKFSDAPDSNFEGEDGERVLHGEVLIGNQSLMLSDTQVDESVSIGTNMSITVNFDNIDEFYKVYDSFKDTSVISQPSCETFFAQRYATLTDNFGILWQFIVQKEAQK